MVYHIYRGRRRLRTHALKTRMDAEHHVRDIRAYAPKVRLRIVKG
jgi:hypothetical protein